MKDKTVRNLYVLLVVTLTVLIGLIGERGILNKVETVLLWFAMMTTSLIIFQERFRP